MKIIKVFILLLFINPSFSWAKKAPPGVCTESIIERISCSKSCEKGKKLKDWTCNDYDSRGVACPDNGNDGNNNCPERCKEYSCECRYTLIVGCEEPKEI